MKLLHGKKQQCLQQTLFDNLDETFDGQHNTDLCVSRLTSPSICAKKIN